MKHLLATIAAVLLVGCERSENSKQRGRVERWCAVPDLNQRLIPCRNLDNQLVLRALRESFFNADLVLIIRPDKVCRLFFGFCIPGLDRRCFIEFLLCVRVQEVVQTLATFGAGFDGGT